MKTRTAPIAAVALVLLLTSTAHAKNFCVTFGGADVAASGLTIPANGACTAFNGFISNEPGVLLAGDLCKSSDGTTVLFNTFSEFGTQTDSLAGTWATASGSGSGNECFGGSCSTFTVTVIKCPKSVPVPDVLSGPESEAPSSFLTQTR